MNSDYPSRRGFIASGTALVLALSLAGCLDDNGDDPGETNDIEDENDTIEDGEEDEMEVLEGHLEDANGWEGETQDHTGEDEITVEVGDPEDGPNYVYDPIAPEIDAGTTVVWEWVDGSNHSVTHEDGEFDSGVMVADESPFEHTFEESGVHLYYCQPHRAQGHLGAVVVRD